MLKKYCWSNVDNILLLYRKEEDLESNLIVSSLVC